MNMTSLHRNAILTGPINAYCLACETEVDEQDAEIHIEDIMHKQYLHDIPYLDTYKSDHIRKVAVGYFCEFCNILLTTATKVKLHIVEMQHINNKGLKFLKRVNNGVVFYDMFFISENAWNGLAEDTCAVCNVDLTDELTHKNDSSHIMNLIQSKIEFGANLYIYRKVDKTLFQCLTCNLILALNIIQGHFDSSEHKKIFRECCELKEKSTTDHSERNYVKITPNEDTLNENDFKDALENLEGTKDHTNIANINSVETNKNFQVINDSNNKKHNLYHAQNKGKIMDNLDTLQKNEINVNFETGVAFCKKCLETIPFDASTILNHIQCHANNNGKKISYPPWVDQNHNKMSIRKSPSDQKISEDPCMDSMNNNVGLNALLASPGEDDTKQTDSQDETDKSNVKASLDGASRIDSNKNKKRSKSKETSKTDRIEAEAFAKDNTITYNWGNDNAFCRLCNVRLPSNLKSMKEHVAGNTHGNNVIIKDRLKNKISKRPMNLFVTSAYTIENIFYLAMIINEEYFIPFISYLMITKQGSVLRCQCCEVTLHALEIDPHRTTAGHLLAMRVTPVITDLQSEFVREVRPGLFHCGFCNLMMGEWSSVSNHLNSSEHAEKKTDSNRLLMQHMPGLILHKMQERSFLRNLFRF